MQCLTLVLSILKHEKTRRLWIACKRYPLKNFLFKKFSLFLLLKKFERMLKIATSIWQRKDWLSFEDSDHRRYDYAVRCSTNWVSGIIVELVQRQDSSVIIVLYTDRIVTFHSLQLNMITVKPYLLYHIHLAVTEKNRITSECKTPFALL